jgi:CBS domain-containing protein
MKTHKAADIMTSPVITVSPDTLLTGVIKILLRWHISGLPVVDPAGKLVGIITEHDIMNFTFSGDAADTRVEEAMTREVRTSTADTPVEEIVNACASHRIRRMPIVDGDRVVGIISRRDVLREMSRIYDTY